MAKNIKKLNLSKLMITDDVLIELGKTCENLRWIDLSDCP
jgi:hypothetical protein